jgi:hypothetical protein
MIYNVSVELVFDAESPEDAETKAYNALSLIPKGEDPEWYEVHGVNEQAGQEVTA